MSHRDPLIPLRHMLDHAREAVAMIQGKSRRDIDDNRQLNLSLIRLLEITGEAANRISKEEQQRYSQIPWSEIVSLRNRLIHGYDTVDLNILWQIVTQDLPPLIILLEKIVLSKS